MKNVFRQIMHHQKQLTNLEQIAADYFMQSKQPIHLRELASEIHLSPATISRFVRKAGFDTYEEFLEAYEYSLKSQNPKLEIDVYKQHIEILNENQKLIQNANLEQIVNQLIGHRVLIVAREDTAFACMDFVNRLKRVYVDAEIATTKQEMVLAANFLKEDDVVIVVSISGYNESIEQFLTTIKDKKLTTIGVSTQRSEMIMNCDYQLELYLDANNIMSFNFSYSLPLIILFDHLFVALQVKLGNHSNQSKDQTTKQIIS